MTEQEKQFIQEYDELLKKQMKTVGLTNPILKEYDTDSLQEVLTYINKELAKIN